MQVPELWALVINMYTVVTCCPLSVEVLCGDNIKLKAPPDPLLGQTIGKDKDTRTIVKFTDRTGRLVEFECRQWQTLLETISSIEMAGNQGRQISLATMLGREDSEVKIVDLRFQPIDKSRWIDIVDSQYESTEYVHLRLAKLGGTRELLSLSFAQKQHHAFMIRTLVLTASRLILAMLENKQKQARRDRRPIDEIKAMDEKILKSQARIQRLHRSRLLSRFMLYAAKYRLMVPDQTNSIDQALQEFDRKMAGQQHRSRRPSSPRYSLPNLSNLWPFRSERTRASSPSDSVSSQGPRSSLDSSDVKVDLPKITLQADAESPTTIVQPSVSIHRSTRRATLTTGDHSSVTKSLKGAHSHHDTGQNGVDTDIEAYPPPPTINVSKRGSVSVTDRIHVAGASGKQETIAQASNEGGWDSRNPTRRHSASAKAGAGVVWFGPSPPRRPLHAEGDAALRIPSRSSNTRSRPVRKSTVPAVVFESGRNESTATTAPDGDGPDMDDDLTLKAKDRIEGPLARLYPFFKWQRDDTRPGDRANVNELRPDEPAERKSLERVALEQGAGAVLAEVHDMLLTQSTFESLKLKMHTLGYHTVGESSFEEVISRLKVDRRSLKESRATAIDSAVFETDWTFHKAKVELVLSTYGTLRCFVTPEFHNSDVIKKLWALLLLIIGLPARMVRSQ